MQATRTYSNMESIIKQRRIEKLRQSRVTLVQGTACDVNVLNRLLNRTYTHVVYLAGPSAGMSCA